MTELLLLKQLLLELGYPCVNTPVVWCDNLASKSMAENPVYDSCTKHIGVDVHFVREKIENDEMEIRYVPIAEQVADVFTKRLPRDRFELLCKKLGLTAIPDLEVKTSARGLKDSEPKLRGSVEVIDN